MVDQESPGLIPHRNFDFDKHPWTGISLWKLGSPVWRFQHPAQAKISKNRHIKEGKNSLTSLASSLSWGGRSECKERLPQSTISPKGESEKGVSAHFPQLCSMLPECSLLSHPTHITERISMAEYSGGSEKKGKREGPQKTTSCISKPGCTSY